MARTPTSEILLTIQAVKQMQVDLATLASVVETIGARLERLEARLDASAEAPDRDRATRNERPE